MKKLNESVLRRLILETIDEQVMTEGKKKKKLKEVEPANSGDPLADESPETQAALNAQHAQTAAGIAKSTGQTQNVPDVGVAVVLDKDNIIDALEKTLEMAKDPNPNVSLNARDMLKKLFKQIEDTLPGQKE